MKEEGKREIEDNYPNLLSVKIMQRGSSIPGNSYKCDNCSKWRVNIKYAKITSLNGNGEIPAPKVKTKFLFTYCRRCGDISEEERLWEISEKARLLG